MTNVEVRITKESTTSTFCGSIFGNLRFNLSFPRMPASGAPGGPARPGPRRGCGRTSQANEGAVFMRTPTGTNRRGDRSGKPGCANRSAPLPNRHQRAVARGVGLFMLESLLPVQAALKISRRSGGRVRNRCRSAPPSTPQPLNPSTTQPLNRATAQPRISYMTQPRHDWENPALFSIKNKWDI